ncbi:mpeU [Symbiodinium natans]|uniref:MpeU protein n=1 Tax=Symbiodinium natans TaxID=878477 RepID=A0A812RJG5_9DINO|nr:mpeU [Symbiodinium natans]
MPYQALAPTPSSYQRERDFSTRIPGVMAVMLAARSELDVTHMQGRLLTYEFSSGHLVYPASSQALHNTLLLADEVDSITLRLTPGEHTQHLLWKLDSPPTGKGNYEPLLPLKHAMTTMIFLPAGAVF